MVPQEHSKQQEAISYVAETHSTMGHSLAMLRIKTRRFMLEMPHKIIEHQLM